MIFKEMSASEGEETAFSLVKAGFTGDVSFVGKGELEKLFVGTPSS